HRAPRCPAEADQGAHRPRRPAQGDPLRRAGAADHRPRGRARRLRAGIRARRSRVRADRRGAVMSSPARAAAPSYDVAAEGPEGRVMVAGAETRLRVSGALWLEAERALIVADVHLEKGSAYAARGQLLPPYDTRDALVRLEAEARALGPRT